MTIPTKWKQEKTSILNMPLDEKKKLYSSNTIITLNEIDSWYDIVKQNDSNISSSPEDSIYVDTQEITLDASKNELIAKKVSLIREDITKLEIDAIVNASNNKLMPGGGVDAAIHNAAGPTLREECDSLGGCSTGHAEVTGGYNLPAKYVIHTVGPKNSSEELLEACYEKCLSYTQEYGIRTIAFPCIATGRYRFPREKAAHVALRTIRKYLETNNDVDRIIYLKTLIFITV